MARGRCFAHARGGRGNRFIPAGGGILILLAVLLFVTWGGSAAARTLAVFPLLDLTVGPNGTNTALTEHVRRESTELGFELVPAEDIMQFMIRHRIRTLGKLSSHEIFLAGDELEADFVLQGTVCQLREQPDATVSLSLQMIRTADQVPVWAHTEGLYYTELLTLLGLNDPQNLDGFYQEFFVRLFRDIPETFLSEKERQEFIDIETVVLRPEYVRPGEEVVCRVRLFDTSRESRSLPQLTARVDGHEYPLALDEEGYYFAGSWPAQERDGEYTVTLAGTWPSGRERSGVIGTYHVDTTPPEIRLTAVGREIEGRTAFNDRLILVPGMVDPEPLTRWDIQVINREGEVLVHQGGARHMPRQITWRGFTNQGILAPDGEYTIVLQAWDRVDRLATAETTVSFLRMPPDITIEVNKNAEGVTVTLGNQVETPIAFWWMKFFDGSGSPVSLAEGDTLPAELEVALPEPDAEEPVLESYLYAQDIMGNRTTMKIANLLLLEKAEEAGEVNMEAEWVEEF
jgi:hypothetical protein